MSDIYGYEMPFTMQVEEWKITFLNKRNKNETILVNVSMYASGAEKDMLFQKMCDEHNFKQILSKEYLGVSTIG